MARYKIEYLSAATSVDSVVATLLLPSLSLEETKRLAEAHLAAIPGAFAFHIRDMEEGGKIVLPEARAAERSTSKIMEILVAWRKFQGKTNA